MLMNIVICLLRHKDAFDMAHQNCFINKFASLILITNLFSQLFGTFHFEIIEHFNNIYFSKYFIIFASNILYMNFDHLD